MQKILIVDDEAKIREVLKEYAEFEGYATKEASDGMEAVKMCKEEDFDILVLDRYTTSNMVHQSSKLENLEERDIFLNWLDDFEYVKLGLPRPTLTIFLDMPVEKSLELAHARKELKNNQKQDIHEKDANHLAKAYEAGKYCKKNGSIWDKCS